MWVKSTKCDTTSCVEVNVEDDQVQVRQTDDPETVIAFTPQAWGEFLARVNAGEFQVGQ